MPSIGDPTSDLAQIESRLASVEHKLLQLRSVKMAGDLAACTPTSSAACLITFISPCYDEAVNLPHLHERITSTCAHCGIEDYEILWIENGSHDDSFSIMKRLQESDSHLRVVQLSRNFGYQGAISCGMMYARGDWVAILDADLQDPPELLVEMLDKARAENYDVVYGVRKKRQEGPLKRAAYRLFYRLWKATADITVPLDAGDFGVMHSRVVDVINAMPERQRFVRGLRAWSGFRQLGFPYERDGRNAGETKFNLRGMVALAVDGLISYSVLPLRAAILFGVIIVAGVMMLGIIQGAFRLLAYMQLVEITGVLPPGLTQVSLVLSGLSGLTLVCVGVVGEYVGRIYNETKDRPLFVVRRVAE